MPGQSDKLGCIRPTPDGPPLGYVSTGSDTGTSESADERRKPRGNDGTRRFEERSTGHLAWPVETAPRWVESPTRTRPLHEPETPNPTRCGAGVGILALQGGEDVKTPCVLTTLRKIGDFPLAVRTLRVLTTSRKSEIFERPRLGVQTWRPIDILPGLKGENSHARTAPRWVGSFRFVEEPGPCQGFKPSRSGLH